MRFRIEQPKSLVMPTSATEWHITRASKQDPGFNDATSLGAIASQGPERVAWREAMSVDNGNIRADEKSALLISGSRRKSEGVAARAIQ